MPQKLQDFKDKRFGRLVVSGRERNVMTGRIEWRCVCDCGTEAFASGFQLSSGRKSSCGCERSRVLAERNATHGLSRVYPAEYRIWKNMRGRCLCSTNSDYPGYGGRGISICAEWSDFTAFIRDMGPRPDGHSLDRIDVNGPYAAWNCRWADDKTQARNKRSNHLIEHQGRTKTLQEWCDQFGLEPSKVRYRLKVGLPPEEAFSLGDKRKRDGTASPS